MKKVLFATTALVASAGFAAAEIELSGSAEMGLVGGDAYANEDLAFHQDIALGINFSGETDNGLTFGAHMELDETNGAKNTNGGWTGDNETVFISGGFGTLTMGETDGAYDKAMQEVALVTGSIADDETAHAGFNGNGGFDGIYDNQILRYDYSFDAFSIHASLEMDDTGAGDDVWGLGFQYDADLGGVELGFGLGFQSDSNTDLIGVSVDAAFGNGFEAAINYSTADLAAGGDVDHFGIGFGYSMDAFGIGVNYGEYDFGAGPNVSGFGLAASYDLGGGASVKFGYGSSDFVGTAFDVESYSIGIAMKF